MIEAAYYNENDPFCYQWLLNLIKRKLIALGDVDGRSIEDVPPCDVKPYRQAHFFAGIGVWSYALRKARYTPRTAQERVWSMSCPCQPFSTAGKGGGFADERHLWPAAQWLVQQCRPEFIVGEQVAQGGAKAWLDLVQSDLEGMGYTFGTTLLCACGFGAPHIRQRTYWMANLHRERRQSKSYQQATRVCAQAHATKERFAELSNLGASASSRLADDASLQERQRYAGVSQTAMEAADARQAIERSSSSSDADLRTRPTDGFWRAADWLSCTDGWYRPAQPGAFPLAHGAAGRVGRLRAYGNAIVAPVATEFIKTVMLCRP